MASGDTHHTHSFCCACTLSLRAGMYQQLPGGSSRAREAEVLYCKVFSLTRITPFDMVRGAPPASAHSTMKWGKWLSCAAPAHLGGALSQSSRANRLTPNSSSMSPLLLTPGTSSRMASHSRRQGTPPG